MSLTGDVDLKNADVVLYFLHGGAYITFETAHKLPFMLRLLEALRRQGVKGVVVALEYPLAPEFVFPMQLVAAEAGWKWLVENTGDREKRVAVLGDSAGGNLALGLMAKGNGDGVKEDGEEVKEERKETVNPGCGVFLLSPWLTTSMASGSYRINRYRDMLALPVLHYAIRCFRGALSIEEQAIRRFVEFMDDGEKKRDWARILGGTDARVWVHAGSHELLVDDIQEWVGRVRDAGVKEVKWEVVDEGLHDPIVVECMEAWPESRRAVKRWLDNAGDVEGGCEGMELVEGLAKGVVEFGMRPRGEEKVFNFGAIEGLDESIVGGV